MSMVILMTPDEADQVRGLSSVDPSHAIVPIELSDGNFFVGVEVLDDPMHAEHKDFLSSLPQADYVDIEELLIQQEPANG